MKDVLQITPKSDSAVGTTYYLLLYLLLYYRLRQYLYLCTSYHSIYEAFEAFGPERLFNIFNATYNDDQKRSNTDYVHSNTQVPD